MAEKNENRDVEAPAEEEAETEADIEEAKAEEAEETEEKSELEKLQEELEEAKDQADEYLEGWQRSRAEFSNYKKRQTLERKQVRELANADLLRKLLPLVDDFERAFNTLPDGLDKLSWTEGIFMIKQKLNAILKSENVEPIETTGETFNPRYHEAVTHEEIEGYEAGEIIGEVQQGYTLGDRVLRPALVRVAKAPAPQKEETAEEEPTEEEPAEEKSTEEK